MSDRSNIIYLYDGSFEGLLCCIFHSYERKELPWGIFTHDTLPCTLFDIHEVFTDDIQAKRVSDGIYEKISRGGLELVRCGFLSCAAEKEIKILDFVRFAMKNGRKSVNMFDEPCVDALEKASRHLKNEVHLLLGFIRFKEYNKVLVSEITPKNQVLPFISNHFSDRYPNESLLIIDRSHNQALACHRGKVEIFNFDEAVLPPISASEREIQGLWKRFYDTIAIESRLNPRCRMGHMPKRYWANMTELCSEESPFELPRGDTLCEVENGSQAKNRVLRIGL